MNQYELTKRIKEKALELGFQKVGIIPVEALEESEKLRVWLNQGYHADMQWMVTHFEKRQHPGRLMEEPYVNLENSQPDTPLEAKSLVCVAMNYYTPDHPDNCDDSPKISKYARGTDYHLVVKERLKELLNAIQSFAPNVYGRALTDSAPIMEKALAVRAGIGWQGKHSNIITRDYGSWLFLGELLLNIELAYEENPSPDFCGSCTRCIDACPTEAIVEAGIVDANRCISYWTIEHKGDEIPENIAPNMQGWVFGCDICQDVCPWNIKFAQTTQEEAFLPRPWNVSPSKEDLLNLTQEQFSEYYGKSPIKRTKLKGLKRNLQAAFRKN